MFNTGLCPMISSPINGIITCSLGEDEVPTEGHICIITCIRGFVVNGSDSRTCGND